MSEPEKMNLEGKKLITMGVRGVALMMAVSRAQKSTWCIAVETRTTQAGPHRRNMRVRRKLCDVY